jgi:hypothetical protein
MTHILPTTVADLIGISLLFRNRLDHNSYPIPSEMPRVVADVFSENVLARIWGALFLNELFLNELDKVE